MLLDSLPVMPELLDGTRHLSALLLDSCTSMVPTLMGHLHQKQAKLILLFNKTFNRRQLFFLNVFIVIID